MSVYNIARKRIPGVGIDVARKNTEKQGKQSLRMSLATQLIGEDVPYSMIQKILGQGYQNLCIYYTTR